MSNPPTNTKKKLFMWWSWSRVQSAAKAGSQGHTMEWNSTLSLLLLISLPAFLLYQPWRCSSVAKEEVNHFLVWVR